MRTSRARTSASASSSPRSDGLDGPQFRGERSRRSTRSRAGPPPSPEQRRAVAARHHAWTTPTRSHGQGDRRRLGRAPRHVRPGLRERGGSARLGVEDELRGLLRRRRVDAILCQNLDWAAGKVPLAGESAAFDPALHRRQGGAADGRCAASSSRTARTASVASRLNAIFHGAGPDGRDPLSEWVARTTARGSSGEAFHRRRRRGRRSSGLRAPHARFEAINATADATAQLELPADRRRRPRAAKFPRTTILMSTKPRWRRWSGPLGPDARLEGFAALQASVERGEGRCP